MGTQAYVNNGPWGPESRKNPAMKWMEEYTNDFSNKPWDNGVPASRDHADDFQLQLPDGKIIKGADAAYQALAQLYGPFAKFHHYAHFFTYWETSYGWEMIGEADLYFKLGAPLEDSLTDPDGNKWQGVHKGAFHFKYVKDGDSIKLKETRIFADASPALRLMLNNKLIGPEQLAGIVIGS